MKRSNNKTDRLKKFASKGFKGYPIATIAYYGPSDKLATKVAVGIVTQSDSEPSELKRWYTEGKDIRFDEKINDEVIKFIKENGAKSVVMADRILGCPHEEGIDYPDGSKCPLCPFWAARDRFTGEIIH